MEASLIQVLQTGEAMCIQAVEYNEATLSAESLCFCRMAGKANTMSYTANIMPNLEIHWRRHTISQKEVDKCLIIK